MAKLNLVLLLIAAAGSVLLSGCSSENRENGELTQTQVQPETVFENDFTKVVRVTMEPGMELVPHEGTDRLIYSLADYSIEWVVNGESEGEKAWSEGDVHVHGPDTHTAINTGSENAEWLAFSRKEGELSDADMQSLENDVNSLEGEYAEMVFDNELFRVTEVRLSPGDSIPSHEGIHRIIFSMSDYTLEYESDETGLVERSFESGNVHWHNPETHKINNTGSSEAQFLIIAYKQ